MPLPPYIFVAIDAHGKGKEGWMTFIGRFDLPHSAAVRASWKKLYLRWKHKFHRPF